MGEMADDAYARAEDEMFERDGYYDEGYGYGGGSLAQLFGGQPRRPEPTLTCPDCRKGGLQWTGNASTGYLFGRAGRHICHAGVLNDFEDLT